MKQQTFSRRDFLRMAGGLAAGALAAGCQPLTPAVVETVAPATPLPPAPVKIEVQSGWCADPASCDIWTPAIKMFNEKYPDITVEFISTGASPEDMMAAMAGGVAPDVYHFYVGGWTELMARGVMFPLDDLIKAAKDYFDPGIYLEPQWEYCTWNGKIYGMPALEDGANPAFSWHKPLLQEIGADAENGPKSWAEVLEWAKKLNKYDDAGNLVRVGYDPRDACGVTVLNWTMAFDVPYISEDKKTMLFDQENWKIGLGIIAQFWQDAGVAKMEAFNQEWEYWTGGLNSGFANGKRAMITNGVWQPGELLRRHADHLDVTTIGYGWQPCLNEGKKYVNFGQEHTLFMPKLTDQPEAGFKFMAHMTSVEVNKLEFEIRGACMWSKPIVEVLDLDSIPGLRWFFEAPNEADKLFSPNMVNTPIQTQVESLWTRAVEEAIYGAKTPEQALLDINSELQQSLDEYWEAQS